MTSPTELYGAFASIFGYAPERMAFAPGRVNLIGEHTDYNGGHVMPCALTMGTLCAAAKRSDGRYRFYSLNMPEAGVSETRFDNIAPLGTAGWTAYPAGVIGALAEIGADMSSGADLMFWGDIPAGAGLSSSAAMEVATGLALVRLFGIDCDMPHLALIGQRAENRYVGMNCGIMDQFASAMGRRNNAIFLNTDTLAYEYAPLELGDSVLLIVNSNVKHSLAGSAYNDRRRECEQALALLKTRLDRDSLCAVTPEEFEANADLLDDPVIFRRARHAVYENARTLLAAEALKAGDIARFGKLMDESHVSLRDDYEVSCEELDILTSLAWGFHGTLGARMTGGGFGGCMVCIVAEEHAEEFAGFIKEEYEKSTGIKADVYEGVPGDGAHVVE